MPLPSVIRDLTPDRLRDSPSVRAIALAGGLIPPRPMHSAAEAQLLKRFAAGSRCVVELGVYEGSSAYVLCDALEQDAVLHLVDPFEDASNWAMRPGWHGTPFATRLAVRRRARNDGPDVRWHIARSQDVGRSWPGPPADFVFIDGDHSAPAVREDWEVWHAHVRPGGAVAFHDARHSQPGGGGSPGPTEVVDQLFRTDNAPAQWWIAAEIDTLVVVQRTAS
jgi:predicted O-methyltransferase YrrM